MLGNRPDSTDNPGFDYTRFNVTYYQKWERMLAYARSRDLIISVIMDWNDSKVHPAALSDAEKRYYASTPAARSRRSPAISPGTWVMTSVRSAACSGRMKWAPRSRRNGTPIITSRAIIRWTTRSRIVRRRGSASPPFKSGASGSIHGWMLDRRKAQTDTGRVIPQTNEEYGYENHYPRWSPSYPGGQSGDADRRAAWEIAMAGAYQTTGETAKRGTGVWPDTGGGWVNGRGDGSMLMLKGYAHMVDFLHGARVVEDGARMTAW